MEYEIRGEKMKKKSEAQLFNHSSHLRRKLSLPVSIKIPIFLHKLISFVLTILISLNWFSTGLAQVPVYQTSTARAPGSSGLGLNDPARVNLLQAASSLDVRVASGSDDAEEKVDGRMYITSTDLEFVFDGGDQVVGMRFTGIAIPQGATISRAYIQFKVEDISTDTTSLTIHGEDVDNATTFGSSTWNISSRSRTNAAVSWSPVAWNTIGEAGIDQQTPDLSSIIQEIINRSNWTQNNSLVIIVSGTGRRVAESYEGDQAGAPLLHIEYTIGNPPQVSISSPANGTSFNLGEEINFTATASDIEDGDLTANISWESNLDGSIGMGGDYLYSNLSIGAHTITSSVTDSSGLTGTDQISISVTGQGGNLPPIVSAGLDQTIILLDDATLEGTVSDDSLPTPPGEVTTVWSVVSGPGSVNFADTSNVNTTASFSTQGLYIIRLTADDGELTASDDVEITVNPSAPITFEARVAASSDDAEESFSGSVGLTSSDLELVLESSIQTVGIRFNSVAIPQGSTIVKASIQFQADETNSEPTSLSIQGQLENNAATFTNTTGNISNRVRTGAAVVWNPDPWTSVGDAGPNQKTPDISAVIQEIVDQAGWSDGNSLAVIITGTGKRVAESFNGDPTAAPLLQVEYFAEPLTNQAPVVDAGQNQIITLPNSALLDGSVTDDALPNPPGAFTVSWSQVSGIGTVTFVDPNAIDTTATFSTAGEYVLRLTADDSELSTYDDVNISVIQENTNQAPSVSAGPDQMINLADSANLDGTVADDSLPNPPGQFTVAWSLSDGPGTVTFTDPQAVDTTASFSAAGDYVLRLTANDSELSTYDEMTVTVISGITIRVPQDHLTIQAGIDAAQNGDLVIVSPDTYPEALNISGKTITLASLFYTTHEEYYINQTIIDGGSQAAITFTGSSDIATKIIGFSIRNGSDGIYTNGKIDILNNRFTNNGDAIDYEGGGGICRDNHFENNSDDAIDLDGATAAIIENNIIRNNGDDGIEVRLHDYTGPMLDIIIRGNLISGNGEDGIQLIDYPGLSDRFFIIERNLIEANLMAGIGLMDGGITIEDYRAASVPERIHLFNNTFSGNDHGLSGGDNLIALNNLFVNSTNIGIKGVDGSSITAYNLFWNNGIDIQSSNIDPGSTLFSDPLLDLNHHLTFGSPAIDAGTAFFEWGGETVLDLPGSAFSGTAPDIGFHESMFNEAPSVNAGADQVVFLPNSATLSGIVTDDGLPEPPGSVNTTWSKVSGSGTVTFANPSNVDTYVSFSSDGLYVLRLTADDGELVASDEVTIKVVFRFVSWADTKSARDQLAALSNQAVVLEPTLTIYEGDLESDGFTLDGMNLWKDAMNGYVDNGMFARTLPVRGNHDGLDSAGWQAYYDLGSTAQALGATNYSVFTEDLTYSFDIGSLHFIGVDVLGSAYILTSEQVNWIDNDLSAAEGRGLTHAFVYFHGPIYCVDGHCTCTTRICPISNIVLDLIEVFNQHPIVSATFHGHEHTYAHVHLDNTRIPEITHPFEQFVTGAAGAGPNECIPGRTDYCMPSLGFVTVDVWDNNFTVDFYQLGTATSVNSMTFTKTGNQSPEVDAGPDQTITLAENASLDGTVADDGLPNPPGALATTWSLTAGPGSVTFADSSAVDTTANFSIAGDYILRLTVNDGELNAYDEITISVSPINNPPVAADDSYSTDEDHSLIIAAPGVLGNDSDVDNDSLTAVTDTEPNNGTLTFNPDGSFNYTPSPNFNGTDSFTYLANDGIENSNLATVTITVNPVNDAPTADANGPYTGTVEISLQFDGSSSNDEDGTIISYDWEFGDGSSGSGPNPTHIYAAAGVFNVVLTVTDDGGATSIDTTTAVILAAPNNPPVAADDSYSTDEDHPLIIAAPGVLGNDSDVDNDSLTAEMGSPPGNGTLTLDPDGSFNYIPGPNFYGTDSFTYLANDGHVYSNLGTVTVTVNPVNDPPTADANGPYTGTVGISLPFDGLSSYDQDGTIISYAWDFGDGSSGSGPNPIHIYTVAGAFNIVLTVTDDGGATSIDTTTAVILAAPNNPPVAADDAYSTDEDHSLIIAAPGVLGNDSDADNDPLTAIVDTQPNNGTLTFNPDGSFNYTPSPNFNGTDFFTYLANDGQENSNVATVTITVNPLNDPPVAVDDSGSVNQGGTLNKAVPGLLSNDNDPDSDPLTVTTTPITLPANGALTLNDDGSYSYIHDGSPTTSDSFVYQVCDTGPLCDTATVYITIVPAAPTVFEVRVSNKFDDAEEKPSGRVSLYSSDLELAYNKGIQPVGIRFIGVAIPQGALISKAYIQFKTDETDSDPTTLRIQGEDSSNALTFTYSYYNITNRNLTGTFVEWNPPAWVNKGDAGPAQQTPDIAAIIQEIVSRDDWSQGQPLVIIITSKDPNKRVAESYNGDQAGAPLLHVEYIYNNPLAANNGGSKQIMTFQ